MNWLHLCIFDISQTVRTATGSNITRLWIDYIFVSLIYRKQLSFRTLLSALSCELTTSLYLWYIANSTMSKRLRWNQLWIDYIFVSLIYRKQSYHIVHALCRSCELTTSLYLWYIANSSLIFFRFFPFVVNWLHLCIFDISQTVPFTKTIEELKLWIDYIFVSLIYRKQLSHKKVETEAGCELTTSLYLWYIANSEHNTTQLMIGLWIDYIFVSLIYRKQLPPRTLSSSRSCELTTSLYLWYIANSNRVMNESQAAVVNWLHLCIFDISQTVYIISNCTRRGLWIDYIFVSLIYRKQFMRGDSKSRSVVNWLHLCIFDISQTVDPVYLTVF